YFSHFSAYLLKKTSDLPHQYRYPPNPNISLLFQKTINHLSTSCYYNVCLCNVCALQFLQNFFNVKRLSFWFFCAGSLYLREPHASQLNVIFLDISLTFYGYNHAKDYHFSIQMSTNARTFLLTIVKLFY